MTYRIFFDQHGILIRARIRTVRSALANNLPHLSIWAQLQNIYKDTQVRAICASHLLLFRSSPFLWQSGGNCSLLWPSSWHSSRSHPQDRHSGGHQPHAWHCQEAVYGKAGGVPPARLPRAFCSQTAAWLFWPACESAGPPLQSRRMDGISPSITA